MLPYSYIYIYKYVYVFYTFTFYSQKTTERKYKEHSHISLRFSTYNSSVCCLEVKGLALDVINCSMFSDENFQSLCAFIRLCVVVVAIIIYGKRFTRDIQIENKIKVFH